jgi:hypothetical protein
MFENYKIPQKGYIFKNWNISGYRATAIAYLKREGLNSVENINGRWYSLKELEESIIK